MRRLSTDGTHPHDEQRIYQDLIELDPMHAEYYWEMLGQLRLEEVRLSARRDCPFPCPLASTLDDRLILLERELRRWEDGPPWRAFPGCIFR